MTNVQEDFLIKAPIPNIFSSNSNSTSLVVVANAMVLGFSHSKHTIRRGITTLASYSYANQIAFSHPTKHFIMRKALKCHSNTIAIML